MTSPTLTYSWAATSGPSGPNGAPGVVFDNASSATPTVRFPGGAGNYTLTLTAMDPSTTASGQSTVQVTVLANSSLVWPNPANIGAIATCGDANSGWQMVSDAGINTAQLIAAKGYSEQQQLPYSHETTPPLTDAGYVIHGGNLVYCWGDETVRYDMKSTTKSMGGLALLLALDDGKLKPDLSDNVSNILNAQNPMAFGSQPAIDTSGAPGSAALSQITAFQLATHTAGLSKPDDSTRALLYVPGSTWSYSDQGLNWLADTLTWTYQQDLLTLLSNRIYGALGINKINTDLQWRNNQSRQPVQITLSDGTTQVARRELASGIQATVNAMARVGLLMLRDGDWNNQPLLSNAAVAEVTQPPPQNAGLPSADATNYPNAAKHYGILWWTNADCQMHGVPKDTFFSWGLNETFIIVVPSLDLVVARAGNYAWQYPNNNSTNPDINFWNGDYARIETFFQDVVSSVTGHTVTTDCSVQ